MPRLIPLVLVPLLMLSLPMSASADGRTEINQALVDAGGGFPFVITAPGSYVLTSDLEVTTDVTAILVQTNDVSIDLNGFRIDGPSLCGPGGCTVGSSSAVASGSGFSVGARIRVHNGIITGFSGTCVELRTHALAADLSIGSCGVNGIEAGTGSLVLRNTVTSVGSEGLNMTNFVAYGHNVVMATGQANSSARSVVGGRASAGNTCHDYGCSPRGERRYYLTPDTFTGDLMESACAQGFRAANPMEIINPGALYWDPVLGENEVVLTRAFGWVREFNAGCSFSGSTMALPGPPTKATPTYTNDAAGPIAPLFYNNRTCDLPARVWCIEE